MRGAQGLIDHDSTLPWDGYIYFDELYDVHTRGIIMSYLEPYSKISTHHTVQGIPGIRFFKSMSSDT